MTPQQVRAALAAVVGAGESFVPDALDYPCVVVQPGDPYLTPSTDNLAPNEYDVAMEVYLLVDPADNADMANQLDTKLTTVLPALLAAGWGVDQVGQPGPWETADWLAYGIQIKTSRYITLDLPTGEQP